jgi:hypothetical protein
VAQDGPSTGAPRPGDPRDAGPRPPARTRDVLWAALGVVLVVVTAVQLAVLVGVLMGGDLPPLGAGGRFLGFAFTVAWLLTVAWFALGAWRRSVWGCPFAHRADAPDRRRCPRHALVDDLPADPGDDTGSAPPR